MTISERIFELLEKQGITQKEFSIKTGIAQSAISDWKRKKTNPVSNKILTICEVLNVTPYELLSGVEDEGEITIPYHVKSVSQRESAGHLLSKRFEILKKADKAAFPDYADWKEDTYVLKKVLAADCYKAIELAKYEFATDKELFSMWQGSDAIRENVIMGCRSHGKLLTMDIRKGNYTKLISYFDKNRMNQLNSFIELKDGMKNDDVDTDWFFAGQETPYLTAGGHEFSHCAKKRTDGIDYAGY